MTDLAPPASIQDEILTFLLSSPTPEEIVAFHASETAQERVRHLLEKNREGLLSSEEYAELEEASQLNHFMILLKARAQEKLSES